MNEKQIAMMEKAFLRIEENFSDMPEVIEEYRVYFREYRAQCNDLGDDFWTHRDNLGEIMFVQRIDSYCGMRSMGSQISDFSKRQKHACGLSLSAF